ncbi:MAG: hypothetical protein QOH65_1158 [Methylobacteriaceae bacterium]|jgi:hypothetical protein|nr:hypothetical protein [Methylobacteriaceae bacterium]
MGNVRVYRSAVGSKEGINFDEVERLLIARALAALGIEKRTSVEITRPGGKGAVVSRPGR